MGPIICQTDKIPAPAWWERRGGGWKGLVQTVNNQRKYREQKPHPQASPSWVQEAHFIDEEIKAPRGTLSASLDCPDFHPHFLFHGPAFSGGFERGRTTE